MTLHKWGRYTKDVRTDYSEQLVDSFTFYISKEDFITGDSTQILWTKVENGKYVSYFLPSTHVNGKWIRDSYYLDDSNIFYDEYKHFEGGKGYVNEFATNDYSSLANAYKVDGQLPVYGKVYRFTGALSGKYKVALGLSERHGNYSRDDYFTTKASVYELVKNTNYSKGSKIDTVTSTNRRAYPDNDYSGSYWYVYEGIANQEPTISGQDEDWGGYKQAFKRYYSVDDGDSGQQLNVVVTLNGVTISTVNNATRKSDYPIDIDDSKFNALTLNEQNTIEITVTDSSGATAVRRYTFKRINTAPVVTMTNAHYGEQNKPFTINFEAADPDGDEITAKLFIDDVQIKDFGTIKGKQSVTIPKIDFAKIPNGEHKIRVEAKDSYNAVGAGYADFSKNLTYAWYRLKKELSEQPSAVIVNPLSEVAPGAKMTIKVCSNVMDAQPTWETVPEELYGQKYNFRNTSKTSAKWGVGVEIRIDKEKATEESYLYGFVGAYM
ncbi:MAG: hypothetical protein ACLRU4_03505 [Peptoniphilus sp.]|uniref:hypothetical protein n=1 Tax=Peptoniphilus sp. TaxID=1971214 RepID=UPI0039A2FBF7